jgi:hypothetical protein
MIAVTGAAGVTGGGLDAAGALSRQERRRHQGQERHRVKRQHGGKRSQQATHHAGERFRADLQGLVGAERAALLIGRRRSCESD